MEYNVGDIVEYIYTPGVKLTVIEKNTMSPTYTSYKLSNGLTVFDSHITLIKAYQPEDMDIKPVIDIAPITIIIGLAIIIYMIK